MFVEISVRDVVAAHGIAMRMDPSSDPTVPDHADARIEGALGAAKSATLYRDDDDPSLVYAAAVLRSLSQVHPFVDGNKKTAWISCAFALEANGYGLAAEDHEVVDLCVRVLTEHLSLDEIAEVLGAWLTIPDVEG